MDRTELQNNIADVIEEYKQEMYDHGYDDYDSWSVEPQTYEQIFAFVEALPNDIPWPSPGIYEDTLYVGWGYDDQNWLSVTVYPGGQISWDGEIYGDSIEDEGQDPECVWGMFPLSEGIPQEVLDIIQGIVVK